MCKIFVVNHPHGEPKYGRLKVNTHFSIPWNCSKKHRRKFIKYQGAYLNKNGLYMPKQEIFFWGEYEPSSDGIIVNQSGVRPRAVHTYFHPVRGINTSVNGFQNTDPYVFGNHFKTICCGIQNRKTQKYFKGDMIMFGNLRIDRLGVLLLDLDTVLIVEDRVNVDFNRIATQYYKASIEPLSTMHYFYRGVNYSPNNIFYSFVPCLSVYNGGPANPPTINLSKMGFKNSRKGYLLYTQPIAFSVKAWNYVLDSVLSSGWSIGVHINPI